MVINELSLSRSRDLCLQFFFVMRTSSGKFFTISPRRDFLIVAKRLRVAVISGEAWTPEYPTKRYAFRSPPKRDQKVCGEGTLLALHINFCVSLPFSAHSARSVSSTHSSVLKKVPQCIICCAS